MTSPGVNVRLRPWILPLLIATFAFVLQAVIAMTMALTADEESHVDYGAAVVRGVPDRSQPGYDSKMPISALNALPRGIGKVLRERGVAPSLAAAMSDFRAARFPTLLAAFLLSLLVYHYASSMFGRTGGLSAQLLCALSPSLMAHETLATTDLYAAAATVLFLFALRQFLVNPTAVTRSFAALALALAQLTKFVALYLYIAATVVLLAIWLYSRYSTKPKLHLTPRSLVQFAAVHAVCFLVVINIGFRFDRTFTPLARYELRSATFQKLATMPVASAVPIPLPYPYVQGFDWMSYHNATNLSMGNIVLMGEVRGRALARSDGFRSYYLAAYALKEPLGMQLLLLLSVWTALRQRRTADFLSGPLPLLVTAAVFLLMLSLFSNTQIGIRHILPVVAIFTVLSGGAFAGWPRLPLRRQLLLGACVLWSAISVATYYPQMIPYFNEWVSDRKLAYRYLSDSNLDWAQNEWVVERYMKDHPEVALNPPTPVTGRVLASANLMSGVFPLSADYWLRTRNAAPIAHVGYAHLLFDVK